MSTIRPVRSVGRVLRVLALLGAASVPGARAQYAQPHWSISLTDAGYSDFLIYTLPPFPTDALHEMLSGEWAAAIRYQGAAQSIWLEPTFAYPEWTTNSNFTTIEPIDFPSDLDGDGINEGSSVIGNGTVEIEIRYDFQDTVTGVAMGVRSGQYVLSDRYVLHQTYRIRNVTASTLRSVRFYQFLHPHPANTETGIAQIVYDPDPHAAGAAQPYRYDVTGWAGNSGQIDNSPTGSTFHDHVSFAGSSVPADWGLGHYRGHDFGKPPCGLHCAVESDTLANELTFGPDEVAGSQAWNLGDLAAGATAEVTVLLAVQSRATGVPAGSCLRFIDTGGDPRIEIRRGACPGPGGTVAAYDVAMGSLAKIVPLGINVGLVDLRCLTTNRTTEYVALGEDAHATDLLYFVARRSVPFSAWGNGSSDACGGIPPCPRVATTSPTAPGLDVCP